MLFIQSFCVGLQSGLRNREVSCVIKNAIIFSEIKWFILVLKYFCSNIKFI